MSSKFLDYVAVKGAALQFFPDCFVDNFDISPRTYSLTLGSLNYKYFEYCREYFSKFGDDNDRDREKIQEAYDYVEQALMRKKDFKINSKFLRNIADSYEGLTDALSKRNSFDINHEALFDFSLFKDIFNTSLQNIDDYLCNMPFSDALYLDIELVSGLKNVYDKLNNANLILMNSDSDNQAFSALDEREVYAILFLTLNDVSDLGVAHTGYDILGTDFYQEGLSYLEGKRYYSELCDAVDKTLVKKS